MRTLYTRWGFKITAAILALGFGAAAFLGSLLCLCFAARGVYSDGGKSYIDGLYTDYCYQEYEQVGDLFFHLTEEERMTRFENWITAPGYAVTLTWEDQVYRNEAAKQAPGENLAAYEDRYVFMEGDGRESSALIRVEMVRSPEEFAVWLARFFMICPVLWAALSVACGALFLLFLILSLCAAGHWPGKEGISLGAVDRIPGDLWVLFLGLCGASFERSMVFLFAFVLALTVGLAPLAAQVKAGALWKCTAIARGLRRSKQVVGWCGQNIPLVWKTVAGTGIYGLLVFLCVLDRDGVGFFCLVLLQIPLAAGAVYTAVMLRRLQQAGRRIARGIYDRPAELTGLIGDFRRHGEELNTVGQGVARVVEERLRAERLKTELITNVSHDIKTPLTSIVSYVDLLKKEETDNPRMREYIEVLDRQSHRLSKLTEDLVEASKAATGNIPVCLEQTGVQVILSQVVGEYEERLRLARITPVVDCPEELRIPADGRLLWRVLDNLLSNVCKYAMPETRVYLSGEAVGDRVRICVKNISKTALTVAPEELCERFVRGDESRSTEGSGLGLSIAMSLTALQGGTFEVQTDGDLFKAVLTFEPA